MPVSVKFDPTSASQQAQIIQNATPFNDGVMTATQAAALASIIQTGSVAFTPVPGGTDTIAAAVAQLPAFNSGNADIFLQPGVYTETAFLTIRTPQKIGSAAKDFGLIGPPLTTQSSGTEAVGDPTGKLFTDGGLALTPNANVGDVVKCTSGANAGLSSAIAFNSPTTVSLNVAFPNPIAPGDTFEIQVASVTIIHSGFAFEGGSPFAKNIKFQSNVDDVYSAFSCFLSFEACKIDGQGAVGFTAIHKSEFNNNTQTDNVNADLNTTADIAFVEAFAFLQDDCFCSAANNNVFRNTSFFVQNNSLYAPQSVFGPNSDFTLITGIMNSGGQAGNPSLIDGDNGSGYIFLADKGSILGGGGAGINRLIAQNSSGDGIVVQGGSNAFLRNVAGSGTTPGFGINAIDGAFVRITPATAISGATNNTNVGANSLPYGGLPFADTVGTLCCIQF
jgi:hypothetical protein